MMSLMAPPGEAAVVGGELVSSHPCVRPPASSGAGEVAMQLQRLKGNRPAGWDAPRMLVGAFPLAHLERARSTDGTALGTLRRHMEIRDL